MFSDDKASPAQRRQAIQGKAETPEADVQCVVALDLADGEPRWERVVDSQIVANATSPPFAMTESCPQHRSNSGVARTFSVTHVTVKDDGYIVGITSKKPITVIERHLEGMHHGLLHVRIDEIHFLVVHRKDLETRIVFLSDTANPGECAQTFPRTETQVESAARAHQSIERARFRFQLNDVGSNTATDFEMVGTVHQFPIVVLNIANGKGCARGNAFTGD